MVCRRSFGELETIPSRKLSPFWTFSRQPFGWITCSKWEGTESLVFSCTMWSWSDFRNCTWFPFPSPHFILAKIVCIQISPVYFGFPSHVGHCRALSRVPCAAQEVLVGLSILHVPARVISHFSHVQLCNPVDCSSPYPSVHGISQARILEWAAISFSPGSSWPRDQTHISYILCTTRWVLTTSTT